MEVKKTITSIFMVPTLKIPRGELTENGFINGYIKDGSREVQYDDCIYLLFQPKDLDKFREFLDSEYERTKAIVDDYDYQDRFVVVVYQLDNKFARDFSLIRRGKYSKTSPAFQAMFPKVIKIKKNGLHRDEISLQYRVFNRTEDLVKFWEDKLGVEFTDDQEVWHGFEEENEILNIEKLKEYVQS
ncbi:MAG: hypothetical protein EBR30_01680 [Cytophagia bacterium]|nr:hypothetical protein [Cytophagia bacterium]